MQVQDEEIYLSDSDGNNDVRDYPVQVRCVKDIYNDEWTLEELMEKTILAMRSCEESIASELAELTA